MESMEAIELRLWSYIDGDCDEAEHQSISALITSNNLWKEKYAELITVHTGLQHMEPEHTSLRFSKNVMEAIADVKPAKATSSYINPFFVRGVIAFSALLIIGVLTYTFSKIQWTSGPGKEAFDYGSIFNNNFVICIFLLNAILLVVIIDTLLRRKRTEESR